MTDSTNGASDKNTRATSKYWCATLILAGDQDVDAYRSKFEGLKEFTTYFIYGEEVGAGGMHHLQCYIVGKRRISLATMCKWFGVGTGNSYAIAKGNPEQNRIYCSKDGKFVEFGELPCAVGEAGGLATKKMWDTVKQNAINGQLDVIDSKIYVTHYRNLKQIKFDNAKPPASLQSPCGEWIFGKSGVGKSRTARLENPVHYVKPMNKWWDNYNGEDVVLIEDFSPSFGQSMEYFMKIWPDCYPFPAEIKNHITMIRPKKIIVTSQYHPNQIWKDEALEAILRRFTVRKLCALPTGIDVIPRGSTKRKQDEKIKKHDRPFLKRRALFKQDPNGRIVKAEVVSNQPKMDALISNKITRIDLSKLPCPDCQLPERECKCIIQIDSADSEPSLSGSSESIGTNPEDDHDISVSDDCISTTESFVSDSDGY